MKKNHLIIIALLSLALTLGCFFGACNTTPGGDNVATYMVYFNNNYDGGVTKAEVESGKTVTVPSAPSRTGYTFKGWFTEYDENASTEFDATKPITQDTTVFAKWEKNAQTSIVTFKYRNLRTPDSVVSVGAGQTVTKPENPKFDDNEMYAFDGWYTDANCTTEYDFTKAVSEDITLYAGWTQSKTTVTFDQNYAGAPAATKVVVEIGKTVTKPADPTRARYEFGGWFDARVDGNEFGFSSPIESAATLYAHWARSEYTLKFDLNGGKVKEGASVGEGTVNRSTIQYTIKRGQSAESIGSNIVSNVAEYEGHTFVGWYNKAVDPDTGKPEDAVVRSLAAINDDMTVYAKWDLKEYTVSFDLNYDGAPAAPESQTVKYGKSPEEPKPTRTGYRLVGWYTDKATTSQFIFGDSGITGDTTLYARWIDSSQVQGGVKVTLKYNIGGTSKTFKEVEVEVLGTLAQANAGTPSENGYLFAGWYEDEALTKPFNINAAITDDMTLHAKMLKGATLEAEKVDFTGKKGQGTSTNSVEEQMIYGQKFVGDGTGAGDSFVSNGLFVRELYYNGAFLEFEFDVDKDVEGAIIVLRVSSESYEFMTTKELNGKSYNYLGDQEFRIIVNSFDKNDSLKYGGLYIPMANLVEKEDLSAKKTPFENMEISVRVNLSEGTNRIILLVDNNNNHGGTFHAEAPMIDCMYIYADAEITQNDFGFDTMPGVNKG